MSILFCYNSDHLNLEETNDIYLQHIIRKNAVRLMLSYRAANVRDREKWVAILDEGFVFTLPITPYRCLHDRSCFLSPILYLQFSAVKSMGLKK